MKVVESSILTILQRRFSFLADGSRAKRAGVRIGDRRWRRAFDDLDRACENLRKRIDRQ
jgi:hypothetical protein